MSQATASHEAILAGDTASIENTHTAALAICLCSENGCKIEIELAPGQILSFAAGTANAELVLRSGDPAGLRVIKPESV
jgi:invasion protein IalB